MNDMQKSFVRLRAVHGKSLSGIARELDTDEATLRNWDHKFADDIARLKAAEYDKITEHYSLDKVSRMRYLAETYTRLQKELDKRDFSGLPTDKLYHILNDVYELIDLMRREDEE